MSEISDSELAEIIRAAKNEGWKYRDAKIGTRYEIGDYVDNEVDPDGEPIWEKNMAMHSAYDAQITADRWGIYWRAVHTNPFSKKEENNG